MIIKTKFDIGDTVFVADYIYDTIRLICEVCEGDSKLEIIGKNKQKFQIKCPSCYDGQVQNGKYISNVVKIKIDEIIYSSKSNTILYKTDDSSKEYKEDVLFDTIQEAKKCAKEMVNRLK